MRNRTAIIRVLKNGRVRVTINYLRGKREEIKYKLNNEPVTIKKAKLTVIELPKTTEYEQ
jgi:acylphosphatase